MGSPAQAGMDPTYINRASASTRTRFPLNAPPESEWIMTRNTRHAALVDADRQPDRAIARTALPLVQYLLVFNDA